MTDVAAAGSSPRIPDILPPDADAVLVRVLRVAFPHPGFPDGPYQRTVAAVLADAAASPRTCAQLAQGLGDLDAVAQGVFAEMGDGKALEVLRAIEATTFFQTVRAKAVVTLYSDPEVWAVLGYEGPSFDQGGYLDRGFDDLDWLPEPRIEGPFEQEAGP